VTDHFPKPNCNFSPAEFPPLPRSCRHTGRRAFYLLCTEGTLNSGEKYLIGNGSHLPKHSTYSRFYFFRPTTQMETIKESTLNEARF